jgi:adenylylsulfate kinase
MPPAGFVIWLTGLPASGKSAIAEALLARLAARGVAVERLESDRLRERLTPSARYTPEERDLFYRALAYFGGRIAAWGGNVIIDATANRRAWRDLARAEIERFIEVWVDCPLEVCRARDRKGTYAKGAAGASATVPGLQDPYEPPATPELVIRSEHESPEAAAERILGLLTERDYLR